MFFILLLNITNLSRTLPIFFKPFFLVSSLCSNLHQLLSEPTAKLSSWECTLLFFWNYFLDPIKCSFLEIHKKTRFLTSLAKTKSYARFNNKSMANRIIITRLRRVIYVLEIRCSSEELMFEEISIWLSGKKRELGARWAVNSIWCDKDAKALF